MHDSVASLDCVLAKTKYPNKYTNLRLANDIPCATDR